MPTTRLAIAPADIARVSELAQVGESTVRRYRRIMGDGVTPCYQLRRAQVAAIERAVAEVARETAQLVLPVVEELKRETPAETIAAWQEWYQRAVGDRFDHVENVEAALGREPVASIAAPPPPETPAPRCTSKSRCHVTILNENDEVIQP